MQPETICWIMAGAPSKQGVHSTLDVPPDMWSLMPSPIHPAKGCVRVTPYLLERGFRHAMLEVFSPPPEGGDYRLHGTVGVPVDRLDLSVSCLMRSLILFRDLPDGNHLVTLFFLTPE